MDCEDVRTYLLDDHRGQLAPELAREVRAHVERCAACAHDDAAEHALSELLERRLPQHPAPLALKRRLAARSEEHTSELQSLAYLVCRLLLEKKKKQTK